MHSQDRKYKENYCPPRRVRFYVCMSFGVSALVRRHLHDAPTRCKLLANAACHQSRSSFQARGLPFHPLSACECRYSMFTVPVKIEC